jgi:hypothetical protein
VPEPHAAETGEAESDEGEVPSAPPVPGGTAPTAETPPDAPPPPSETAPVEVGASDPELAAAVAELPQETQDLFTEAVQEELAPVLEEIMGEIEGLEDLSAEDIEAAFAAAIAEAGLATASETN